MTDPSLPASGTAGSARFRRNLIRVLGVQVVALILLWLLQRHYTP